MSKTLIIDGNNLLYRSFWVSNFKAENNLSSTFVFLKTLKSYAEKFNPWDKIYCIWDKRLSKNATNFRSEISFTEYKGNRNKNQFGHIDIEDTTNEITNIIEKLGIFNLYPWRMEADDVISWLCDNIEGNKLIISNDKDMLQLINEHTSVYNPLNKITYNKLNFKNLTDFDSPRDYFWFRCFTGDKSDNLEGIYRFGIKKYKKITTNWNYENLKDLPLLDEEIKIVENNKKIMDLKYGYTHYEDEVITYRAQFYKTLKRNINFSQFLEECEKLKFDSIKNNSYIWSKTFVPANNTLSNQVNKIREKIYNEQQ